MKTKIFQIILSASFFLFQQIGHTQDQYSESDVLTIEIHTGDLVDAGTNNEHILTLFFEDSDENFTIKLLKHIDGNGLERGTVDKFSIEIPKLGKLSKILVKPESIFYNQWYLNKIIITNDEGLKYRFNCNCWIATFTVGDNNSSYLHPSSVTDSHTQIDNYSMKVKIKTGGISGAGTNSNIYLTLTTEDGNGTPLKLNSKISGNAFEEGDTDVAFIEYDVFKDLKSINIRHDNKGVGSDWYLEELSIETPNKDIIVFECNCWMTGDNNVRKLTPKLIFSESSPIFLQSAIAGKFLDVQWGNTSNNTPMHLWPSNQGKAQEFYLEKADDEYFYIRSALSSNKYLHVAQGSPRKEAKVVLWDGKGMINTKWKFEKLNTDYYLIKSKLGTYLDVQWASPKDGTPIHMWELNKGDAQQWRIMTPTASGLRVVKL